MLKKLSIQVSYKLTSRRGIIITIPSTCLTASIPKHLCMKKHIREADHCHCQLFKYFENKNNELSHFM